MLYAFSFCHFFLVLNLLTWKKLIDVNEDALVNMTPVASGITDTY